MLTRQPGRLNSDGQLVVKGHHRGDLEFPGDVVLWGATVDGSVKAGGNVILARGPDQSSRARDTAMAAAGIFVPVVGTLAALAYFANQAENDVGSSARTVKAEGNVTLDEGCRAGQIGAGGSVGLDVGARAGSIEAGRDVTLGGWDEHTYTSADGIIAGGAVKLSPRSSAGAVQAGDGVVLEADFGAGQRARIG